MALKGKVMNFNSKAPLPYASVSIKGKSIGTVTNTDGEFEFRIPENYLNDTLQISMLGYAPSLMIINAIESNQPLVVRLKESPVLLKEVVVVAKSLSANEIFKKAFDGLEKTFPQENYLLKGFYRQINTENNKNVFLVEASINIFDNKTQLNNNFKLRERISLNQVRLSNSLFKNTDPNYFEGSNTLTWLLLFNYTKYRNKYVMERTNFVLDSTVRFNQRSFYVVSSTVASKELTNKFTLYIDTEDFSFLRIKNETVANKGYYVQNFDVFTDKEKSKVLKLTATRQTYQFERYNNLMFLKHAHSYSEGEIANLKTNAIEWKVTDENLLVINEIVTSNVKTPTTFLMDNRKNIKFLARPYDEKFWSNFGLVNLVPLTNKQRSDLEDGVSLEKQFKSQIVKK
ncbi:MAG TPA: carboxypeptidase-like regulatory domain-containing protein [Cyclobacteriaceae bacterium]|nr:carboxypeptidase-like regulatory domain-containing protein [Cyclobacteriaceae bacterium]